MLVLTANGVLLEQSSPGLILRLHLTLLPILIVVHLVLEDLLVLLDLVVEDDILLELVLIVDKQRMLDYARERHSLLAIHHEDPFEEVLQVSLSFLQPLLLTQGTAQTEEGVGTPPGNLSLQLLTYVTHFLPLKGYSANSMK